MKKIAHFILTEAFFICFFCGCKTRSTDKELIHTTMNNWKNAVLAQDIDTIMEHYSEIYSAHEAKSKEEMREFWEEVIEAGMLENIVINL